MNGGDDDPQIVPFNPHAYLTDVDFQAMTAQERGAVFTVLLYLLAASDSKICVKEDSLCALCGCKEADWEQVWGRIDYRFNITKNNGLLEISF